LKGLPIIFGSLMAAFLLAALAAGADRSASAQTSGPPDFTQFGFPRVVGTVTFSPGQTQQVVLPADFYSKTVKFELLEGDASFFEPSLPITYQGRTVIVAFAFRVTDVATNQLVARFDKPVQWSVTDPRIAAGSAVFNTTAANPPGITANAAPGTISGTTLSHPFGGAGVGWLVLGAPAAQATPGATETAAPTAAPTLVPTEVATQVPTVAPLPVITPEATAIPIGMPRTGGSQGGIDVAPLALWALLALAGAAAGVALRRRQAS
jgi:hypothetical protein